MVEDVLGKQKEYQNKNKEDILISLFVHFCYMFILDAVRCKMLNSAKRFNIWLSVLFEK